MIAYCFELTVYWAVSYCFYALLLEKLTFFTLNRFFIVVNLFVGLIWPLISVEAEQVGAYPTEVLLPVVEVSGQVLHTIKTETALWPADVWWLLGSLYAIISLALAFRLAYGLYKLWQIRQRAVVVEPRGDINMLYSREVAAPFSFFSYLILPQETKYTEPELAQIMAHERCHIREKHSFDILLCEVLHVLFWWNPLVILWKRALIDQHEYLADQAVLQDHAPQEYGHFLLRQLQVCTPAGPVHTIFQSPIKKRMIMMTSSFTSRTQMVRYFLFIPVMLCTHVLVTQAQTTKTKPSNTSRHKPVVLVDTIITVDPRTWNEEMKIVKSEHYESADVPPVYGTCASGSTADQLQACSLDNLMQFLGANLRYPESARNAGVQGNALVSFIINEQGKLENPVIVQSLGDEIDSEVLRVVGEMGTWSPAVVNGKAVRFKYSLPVRFKL